MRVKTRQTLAALLALVMLLALAPMGFADGEDDQDVVLGDPVAQSEFEAIFNA